jgi:hypothetical protein
MTVMHKGRQGTRLGIAALFASLLLTACGLTAPRSSDGYADLESLGVRDVDRTLSLSFGPTLLRFAASHMDDEPELSEMIGNLDGIRIRIYEIDGDPSRVASKMDNMSTQLRADGWQPVLLVREKNEQTHMLIKTRDAKILGMAVLTSDGESEAVVINLMGDIQPERFSDVMVALDVEAPGIDDLQVAQSIN